MEYKRPGDEATDISGSGEIGADSRIIELVEDYNDSICARAVLYAVHESLANIIAKSSVATGLILPTIDAEIHAHIRSNHKCKNVAHHHEVVEIAREWAEDLTWKVECYAKQNQN